MLRSFCRFRPARSRTRPVRLLNVLLAMVPALLLASLVETHAQSMSPLPRYTIAVLVSTDSPARTGPPETLAIEEFVKRRIALINEAGGINGHHLDAVFYDDFSKVEKTKENVARALAHTDLIAMIGIWTSTRGAPVVEAIGKSGVPFISELSVEKLFTGYPNIYTLTRSINDEQEVFQNFANDGYKRVAFVGADDDLYTRTYAEHLQTLKDPVSLVSTFWLKGNVDDQLETVDKAIEEIKVANPDLIFLSIGSKRGGSFLARLTAAGVKTPVFLALGSVNGIMAEPGGAAYGGALYEIAEGGIANLNNERLEQLMRQPARLGPIASYQPYAVGYGARYADLVALIAEAAAKSATRDIGAVRATIRSELSSLQEGRRVWTGWAQDWTFTKDRASAERSLIVWRPEGEARSVLAPIQYVRGITGMQRVPVLYVHLDMNRIFRVDSNDKSFEAEFFFTLRSAREIPITSIEFTNAYHSPGTAQSLIHVREVHQDQSGLTTGDGVKVYKVSGRFTFEPDLRSYPFDEQIFSISFQPAKTSAAFFLQPPSETVRSSTFRVDGWRIQNHYVGTNEQIIRTIGGPLSDARIIPYYNFNYTWVMKRQVVDYVLRVIVPLSFILIVAYIANFIPRSEFEAIMAIQVTALLSAIALYLALNQPLADDATLSDKIFVMAYATISAMIALSIFEVNETLSRSAGFLRAVHVVQMYLLPVVALAMISYVLFQASSNTGGFDLFGGLWKRMLSVARGV